MVDCYFYEVGVIYCVFGDSVDWLWVLSYLLFLIDEVNWKQFCVGIIQCVELFECVLCDIYGEGWLVVEGVLFVGVIVGSFEFLCFVCGVLLLGGCYLLFYVVDVG